MDEIARVGIDRSSQRRRQCARGRRQGSWSTATGAAVPSFPERELDRELSLGKAPEPEQPAPEKRIDMDLSL